jgi:hypothetical protein
LLQNRDRLVRKAIRDSKKDKPGSPTGILVEMAEVVGEVGVE